MAGSRPGQHRKSYKLVQIILSQPVTRLNSKFKQLAQLTNGEQASWAWWVVGLKHKHYTIPLVWGPLALEFVSGKIWLAANTFWQTQLHNWFTSIIPYGQLLLMCNCFSPIPGSLLVAQFLQYISMYESWWLLRARRGGVFRINRLQFCIFSPGYIAFVYLLPFLFPLSFIYCGVCKC